ncbi:MAG: hypothetical protein H0U95_15400 [Bacteroidetes bacterium]|nr:hypothetical protein [Bacteroidota bacterium]
MNTKENNNSNTKTPSKKGKFILIGLGVLATSLLTFFGIQYWKKNKKTSSTNTDTPDFDTPKSSFTKKEPQKPKTSAPKKKHVEHNAKIDPTAKTQPKTEPQAAPHKDKTESPDPPLFQAEQLSEELRDAIVKKDFVKTFVLLKKIRNTNDYKYLSPEFIKYSITGVRRTLVNALLYVFKLESQRKLLFLTFKRIGLKYQNNQWTLGDLDGSIKLITNQATKVWKNPKEYVSVPVNMVLGREVCKRGAFTLFENQHQYYLVESTSIKNHQ